MLRWLLDRAAASYGFVVRGRRFAMVIAPLFVQTSLVSREPQKYVDSAFAQLWPALIVAQVEIAVVLWHAFCREIQRMRFSGGKFA